MARFMNNEEYYRERGNNPVPIKWMAPESILQKVYSEKSDVVSKCPQTEMFAIHVTYSVYVVGVWCDSLGGV